MSDEKMADKISNELLISQKVVRWLSTDRVGSSSKALASFMFGRRSGHFSTPWDSGDFGRCHYFLSCADGLVEKFKEMDISEMGARWVAIQKNFEELDSIFVEMCKISGCKIGIDYNYVNSTEELKKLRTKFRTMLDTCNKKKDETDNSIHIKVS